MTTHLEAFNQWVCVEPCINHHHNEHGETIKEDIYPGQTRYFHEDDPPDKQFFKLVVNEKDEPVKIFVRWND